MYSTVGEEEVSIPLIALVLVLMFQTSPRAGVPGEGQAALVLTRSIEMPRVEGRIDHLTIDLSQQRLFVAALGNDTVEVIDGRAGTWLRRSAGFHEPQGIAFVPDAGLIAVANGQSGDLVLLQHFGPGMGQPNLPDRSRSLAFFQLQLSRLEAQAPASERDGTG